MNWASLLRSHHRPLKTTTAPQSGDSSQPQVPAVPPRVPAVSIHETPGAIVVIADLPGVTQDQLEVTMDQDLVTLRGSVSADTHAGFQQIHHEYDSAGFERSFTLPAEVDREHIDATVKHGVLTLTLPKHKSLQPRRISVTSE